MEYREDTEKIDSILWRFMVYPGHEFCRLYQQGAEWHLEGTAVFAYEHSPCRLSYEVICDASWRTLAAKVEGWVRQTRISVQIRTDQDQRWWMNEVEALEVRGCTDIDLNFSPSTNTIPIRRLNLAAGETAEVKAAWLRFPGFTLEPLEQRYQQLEEGIYRYESGGGRFVVDLRVNRAGFVNDYPGIWIAEASSGDR
jgi:hypothetical protein